MRAIQPIAQNEQIYNTYGNRPNSDLLRGYGYVISGSKDDSVEISADLIIDTISRLPELEVRRRVDILDEEGWFEECVRLRVCANFRAYEILYSGKIPEEMYVFCLSIMADNLEEGTIPQYHKTAELKRALLDILSKRMGEYPTSVEEDVALLSTQLETRKRMAIEVRLGEKRILRKAIGTIEACIVEPPAKRMKMS